MATYENYKINGRTISEILEDSSNRSSVSTFNNFYIGSVNNPSVMSFAQFLSNYHPYNPDTMINNFYSNSNKIVNKGCVPKGFAPLLNNHDVISGGGTYKIKVTGSGYFYKQSRVRILKGNVEVRSFNSPNVLIIGIQAGGGGGQNGSTGIAGGNGGKGGGNGGYIPIIVELPYSVTSESVFLTINVGSGGSAENAGGNTQLKLGDNGETLITLIGGLKGNDSSFYNYRTNTVNNNILKSGSIIGSLGTGRVKICPQMRYISYYYSYYDMNNTISGYGVSGYSGGGNYYSNYIVPLEQCSSGYNSGRLTSGNTSALSIKSGYGDGSYGGSGNAGPGAGSMMGTGGYSGGGGVFGGSGGGAGENGSGGGGGARGGIFWTGAGKGGPGGDGAFEIYY